VQSISKHVQSISKHVQSISMRKMSAGTKKLPQDLGTLDPPRKMNIVILIRAGNDTSIDTLNINTKRVLPTMTKIRNTTTC
jgi:hypothetical protein